LIVDKTTLLCNEYHQAIAYPLAVIKLNRLKRKKNIRFYIMKANLTKNDK